MSIEQRRITRLKKKKIAKFQKLVKNKAAEFKRKVDLLRIVLTMITGSRSGISLEKIISILQRENSIVISASAIESLLGPDLKAGTIVRLVKGEGTEPRDINYRASKK